MKMSPVTQLFYQYLNDVDELDFGKLSMAVLPVIEAERRIEKSRNIELIFYLEEIHKATKNIVCMIEKGFPVMPDVVKGVGNLLNSFIKEYEKIELKSSEG